MITHLGWGEVGVMEEVFAWDGGRVGPLGARVLAV
jgi:hypothetical protein